jgi:hypothetical protein
MAARGIVVSASHGIVTLSGLTDGEQVSFYAVDGSLLSTVRANGGTASLAASDKMVVAKVGR